MQIDTSSNIPAQVIAQNDGVNQQRVQAALNNPNPGQAAGQLSQIIAQGQQQNNNPIVNAQNQALLFDLVNLNYYDYLRRQIEESRAAVKELYPVIDRSKTKAQRMVELKAIDNKDYKIKSKSAYAKDLINNILAKGPQVRYRAGWEDGVDLGVALLPYLKRPFVPNYADLINQAVKYRVYNFQQYKYQKKKLFAFDLELQMMTKADYAFAMGQAFPGSDVNDLKTYKFNNILQSAKAKFPLGNAAEFKTYLNRSLTALLNNFKQNMAQNQNKPAKAVFLHLVAVCLPYLFYYDDNDKEVSFAPAYTVGPQIEDGHIRPYCYATQVVHLLSQTSYPRQFLHWTAREYQLLYNKTTMTISNSSYQCVTIMLFNSGLRASSRDVYCLPMGASITLTNKQFSITDYIFFFAYGEPIFENAQGDRVTDYLDGQGALTEVKVGPDSYQTSLMHCTVTFAVTSIYEIKGQQYLVKYDPAQKIDKPSLYVQPEHNKLILAQLASDDAVCIGDHLSKLASAQLVLQPVVRNMPYVPYIEDKKDSKFTRAIKKLQGNGDNYAKRWALANLIEMYPGLSFQEQLDAVNIAKTLVGQRFTENLLSIARQSGISDDTMNRFAQRLGIEEPYIQNQVLQGSYLQKRRRDDLGL